MTFIFKHVWSVDPHMGDLKNVFSSLSHEVINYKNVVRCSSVEHFSALQLFPFYMLRTLPGKHLDKIAEQMRIHNINALLVIGGFEVRNVMRFLSIMAVFYLNSIIFPESYG